MLGTEKCSTRNCPIPATVFLTFTEDSLCPAGLEKSEHIYHAIFKKGDRSLASNYRPIFLTSVSCKIMEYIIFSHIMSNLEEFKILSDIQHGLLKSHSCETQLLITLEDLARNLNHGKQSDIILLYFAKASSFDTVPHQRLHDIREFKQIATVTSTTAAGSKKAPK